MWWLATPPHQNNKNQDNKEMMYTDMVVCNYQHENDRSASELPCISHAKFNSSTASHPKSPDMHAYGHVLAGTSELLFIIIIMYDTTVA